MIISTSKISHYPIWLSGVNLFQLSLFVTMKLLYLKLVILQFACSAAQYHLLTGQ